MNVVDSCGWLEYFANGPNADFFEPALIDDSALLVPAITLFEVSLALLRQRGGAAAQTAQAFMTRGKLTHLDPAGLLRAAQAAIEHRLSVADALIWQAAFDAGASLWTQDADLARLPGVRSPGKAG